MKTSHPSSITLLSGGLDSYASFHWARENTDIVCAVTFDYGQFAAPQEMAVAKKICERYEVNHRIIELTWFKGMTGQGLIDKKVMLPALSENDLDNVNITKNTAKQVWIPNRNGVFINVTASLAEEKMANMLVVGFNAEEAVTFPDNSLAFVEKSNQALAYSTLNQVKVMAPMGDKNKTEIVKWLLKNDVPLDLLWSCYQAEQKMCGVCESCLRLKRALKSAGASASMEVLF
ncbi:7-cyano-7-deazaguanine synthase QueC [bacterium]|nr:7-cyano-7-deazaguanine synthase QueC [bacterium]